MSKLTPHAEMKLQCLRTYSDAFSPITHPNRLYSSMSTLYVVVNGYQCSAWTCVWKQDRADFSTHFQTPFSAFLCLLFIHLFLIVLVLTLILSSHSLICRFRFD